MQVLPGNQLRRRSIATTGAVSALPTPIRKVNNNRLPGVARPGQTIAAKAAAVAVVRNSATIRNLRLSTMSAKAPAGSANRNIGNVVATCTIDTMNGSGLRLVISHPEAALYIQLPMLAMTVAVHKTENVVWRNGLHGEEACPPSGAAAGLIASRKAASLPANSNRMIPLHAF